MTTPESRLEQLLEANANFAKSWSTPPTMEQIRAAPGAPVLCLTCMDPRVVPEQFLGPQPMIATFRNAGGRYSKDAVRTILTFRALTSQKASGTVMVVHHTDCGMTHLTDEEIRNDVTKRGLEVDEDTAHADLGCYPASELEKSIRDDVKAFQAEPMLAGIDFRGYVLTTETGLLRELEG